MSCDCGCECCCEPELTQEEEQALRERSVAARWTPARSALEQSTRDMNLMFRQMFENPIVSPLVPAGEVWILSGLDTQVSK